MAENIGVYKAIANVQSALVKEGISKDRRNEQQKYKFRGIDDIYNALAPILAANGLVILPRVISRECVERSTKSGGALFYVTVNVEFLLVSAADGSNVTISTFGEAMDSADKATNKAMSAAYKYACIQAFCIPTEGDNDADAHTHVVDAKSPELPKYEVLLWQAETIDDLADIWRSIPKDEQLKYKAAKDKRKAELEAKMKQEDIPQ